MEKYISIKKAMTILVILMSVLLQNTVALASSDDNFSDVKATAWYYNDIMEAQRVGLVEGVGGNKFAPNETITYAHFLTIIARIVDDNLGNVGSGDKWYDKYIKSASRIGAIDENEIKDPNAGITRQDMIKFTCKALGVEPLTGNELIFNDVKAEDAKYINAAYYEYLTNGIGGYETDNTLVFGWNKTSNRAELASMALRIKAYKDNPEAYKAERAEERAVREQKYKETKERSKFEISDADMVDKWSVSEEKSILICEEFVKNVVLNQDMTITVTAPDILPKGWRWNVGITCEEKNEDWYTVFNSSMIALEKPVTTKLFTDAKNIKEYILRVEFTNGLDGNVEGYKCSSVYIVKNLNTGETRIRSYISQSWIQ